MKLINRIFLSVGSTASVIAPVATVIACNSSSAEISQDAIKQRELYSKAQTLIDTKYQELLIAEISAQNNTFGNDIAETSLQQYATLPDAFKSEIKEMIFRNIYASPTYLTTLADKLLHMVDPSKTGIDAGKFFDYNQLATDGFYDYYLPNTDIASNSGLDAKLIALINKYITIIWNENVANFKNIFYQFVIGSYYLDTNKDDWSEVFYKPLGSTGKINGLEGNIKPEEFVLGQRVLRAKLAYDWTISLNEDASKAYVNQSKTESELNAMMTAGGAIWTDAAPTQQLSLMPSFYFDANAANATRESIWKLVNESKAIIGFAGFADKSTYASSDSKIKQIINPTIYNQNYEGYINSEKTEIVNEDSTNDAINLTTASNSKVTVEKVVLIMPTYVDGQLTMDFLGGSNTDNKYQIIKKIIFGKQGQDIYREAIKYYSSKDNHQFNWDATKKEGGIRLTILDDELKKMALDTFNLEYVNK